MGNSDTVDGRAPIHTFYSAAAWVEGAATRQLQQVAELDGVLAVAGMPDLHPGKYGPVGCAVLSQLIHPQLVGSDIGCGMGLFQLDLAVRKLKVETAADRLGVLEGRWDGSVSEMVDAEGLASCEFDSALGTIGGGNHFCELQAIDDVLDADAAAQAGLDVSRVHALVHSGSRGLGSSILQQQTASGLGALTPGTSAASDYLGRHDAAVRWAALNRQLIARRAAEALRADAVRIVDLAHNMVEATTHGLLHRKGAAAADRGLVPVPGSRGTLSYLVQPIGADRAETLASLAHGAGRKHERSAMHGRTGATRSERANLARNPFGGRIVCTDRNLLVEEAPQAYKNIAQVIADLEAFGLAKVVATFRPLVTFKTARQGADQRDRLKPRRGRDRGGVK